MLSIKVIWIVLVAVIAAALALMGAHSIYNLAPRIAHALHGMFGIEHYDMFFDDDDDDEFEG